MKTRSRVAVFDMFVTKESPAGSCVLAEIIGLAEHYDITVFSNRCDAANVKGVEWRYIPLLRRPVLIRYWLFHLIAPIYYLLWRLSGKKADCVQATQGQFIGADVAYAHFCHGAYLAGPWQLTSVRGARRVARFLTHKFNAYFERRAFRAASKIVVPSKGLANELAKFYPDCVDRIVTIPNPVDLKRFQRPNEFDRNGLRLKYGFSDEEIVLVFVALGDFSRKGLGLVIDAIALLPKLTQQQIKLLVVGGQPGEIRDFSEYAYSVGLQERVRFVGMQSAVEQYLWASDIFVLPSAYETFSLVIYQALAASLSVIVSAGLYGAEDIIIHGENGWYVERSIEGVCDGIQQAVASKNRLHDMTENARLSVLRYSKEEFVEKWEALYSNFLSGLKSG
jgi:glycosyltransferase involved in cell wall biosynthesis